MEDYEIYIPPETYVLNNIAEVRLRGRGLRWRELVNLCISSFEYHKEFSTFEIAGLRDFAIDAHSWPSERQSLPRLISELYKWLATKKGISHQWIGDKTPLNTVYLGKIRKILPHCSFLYIYRDGVDVATSYVKAGIYRTIDDAALRWVFSNTCWQSFKKSLAPTQFWEISYESLVADPQRTVSDIASFFGIPPRTNPLDVREYLGDVIARDHHRNVMKRPSAKFVGQGRKSLNSVDRRSIAKIVNPTLKALGYPEL
jgi:hypothetical protein